MSEQEFVREQYATDANLCARIELHERFSTSTLSYPRWVFDGYDFAAAADVLEVGCGNGLMWRENLDRLPDGWRLTLTDLSPGMVHTVREALGDRAEYAVADAQELPFDDASFDAVIANHMLFHVPDRPGRLPRSRASSAPAAFSARRRSVSTTCAGYASSSLLARAGNGRRHASGSRSSRFLRSSRRSSSTSRSSPMRIRSR